MTLRTFEIPEYLHRVKNASRVPLDSMLVLYSLGDDISRDCLDGSMFCAFQIIPKLYKCAILLGIARTVHSISMQYISIKFNERAFRKRLLESRFKLYVVDHLKEYAEQRATQPQITFRPLDYSGGGERDALMGSQELGTVEEIVQLAEPTQASTKRLSTRPGDFGLFRRIFQVKDNIKRVQVRQEGGRTVRR